MSTAREAARPRSVPGSLRALCSGLVDYAGTFPPSKLTLEAAARDFAGQALGEHRWMLGRFVVPVAQLGGLEAVVAKSESALKSWPLTVLLTAEQSLIDRLGQALAGRGEISARLRIESAEIKLVSMQQVTDISSALPRELPVYCELADLTDPGPWLEAIRYAGWRAKVRTGGVTAEMFPSPGAMARFLVECSQRRLAFKATAGLHHPVRAEHRFTYDADSACGIMHGFLNVFLAAAFAREGWTEEKLTALLEDQDAGNLSFADEGARWQSHFISTAQLAATRQEFATSFGSCSFSEPVHDLQELGLL
jgi:hypothetical protein